MSIETIKSVNFGEDKKKNNNEKTLFPYLSVSAVGAATGGYFFPRNKNANDLLRTLPADTLEISGDLSDEERRAIETVNTQKQKAETIKGEVAQRVKTFFPEGTAEITVEDYLRQAVGNEVTTAEALQERIKAQKAAIETAKGPAKARATAALDELLISESTIKAAQNGKITKEILSKKMEPVMLKQVKATIDDALKALGEKCPKTFSGKAIGIGAAIGLAVAIVSSLIFGKKEK